MILLSFSISLVESGEVLKSLTSQLGSRSSLRYMKYYTHYNVRWCLLCINGARPRW